MARMMFPQKQFFGLLKACSDNATTCDGERLFPHFILAIQNCNKFERLNVRRLEKTELGSFGQCIKIDLSWPN